MEQYNPRKNKEGYTDLTAYEAEKKLQGKRSKMVGALFEQIGKMRKAEAYHADRTYYPRVNRMEQEG